MFDDEFFDMAIQAGGHDEGIESGMEVCDWKLVSGSMEIKGQCHDPATREVVETDVSWSTGFVDIDGQLVRCGIR